MKTPRELLLHRHAPTNAKLDAIREQVLAAECGDAIGNPPSLRFGAAGPQSASRNAGAFWRALLWPHPKAWAGLAAVWVAIIGINLSLRESSPAPVARRAATPTPQVLAALQEQKRLLAELIDSTAPAEAVPAGDFRPRPRSEARRENVTA